MNRKFNNQKGCLLLLLTQVQTLSKLFIKKDPGKGKNFHLCFVLLCVFGVVFLSTEDGGTKACAFPISCHLTRSCVLTDKTNVSSLPHSSQFFFACHLYVMMYCIVYHSVTLVSSQICILSHEKLYRCGPSCVCYKAR